MNKVCLVGNITRDLELRTTQSGTNCVRFNIAINNGKDENGEQRKADFPTIYVYGKQAENMAKYCKQGSKVGVEGRLKTRDWDKEDGTKGYETYVRADYVEFMSTRSNSMPLPEPDYIPGESNEQSEQIPEPTTDPYKNFGQTVALSDDDLPF